MEAITLLIIGILSQNDNFCEDILDQQERELCKEIAEKLKKLSEQDIRKVLQQNQDFVRQLNQRALSNLLEEINNIIRNIETMIEEENNQYLADLESSLNNSLTRER